MHDMSAHAAAHHAPPQGFIRKYVFSVDHKVIGIQYTTLGLVAVFIGMALSWVMRIHLAWPTWSHSPSGYASPNGAPGGVPTPEYYLSLMTMHGTIMAFFVLTAAPMAGYGNFMLPIQVGAADMAFPAVEHGIVLGHVRRLRSRLRDVCHSRRSAAFRLDRVRAAERRGLGCGSGSGLGPKPLGTFDRGLLRRVAARGR